MNTWYECKLARRAVRTWKEDFIDEDTGEKTKIERQTVLIERLTPIAINDYHILAANGIQVITVYTDAPSYKPPKTSDDADIA